MSKSVIALAIFAAFVFGILVAKPAHTVECRACHNVVAVEDATALDAEDSYTYFCKNCVANGALSHWHDFM